MGFTKYFPYAGRLQSDNYRDGLSFGISLRIAIIQTRAQMEVGLKKTTQSKTKKGA